MNLKRATCAQSCAFVVLGFLLISQDATVVHSAPAQDNGFLFGFLRPVPIVGDMIKGAEQTVQNIFTPNDQNKQQKAALTTKIKINATQNISTQGNQQKINTSTPKTGDFLGDIFKGFGDMVRGGEDMFENVFMPNSQHKLITTTTTTPKPDLLGGLFGGLGQLFGLAPTTTTTTLHPPPRGGRGFSGVVYNIIKIITDFFDLMGNALLINDDWEPGYIRKKLEDVYISIKSEIDIFLQSDEPGGLGEIWKSITAVWNDLVEMFNTVTSGDMGKMMIGLPLLSARTLGDIGNLNNEFAIQLPDMSGDTGRQANPEITEKLKQNEKQFENIMNHIGNMITGLLDIEEAAQKLFPNSTILQVIGYFRQSFEKALNNTKETGKPIVMNTLETMFPSNVIADYIAEFGTILSDFKQFFGPLEMVGDILQQKFIVSIGISLGQALINPLFENIEKFIESFVEGIGVRLVGLDPNNFVLHLIDTLKSRFDSYAKYIRDFEKIQGKIKLNFTEGHIFEQIADIVGDLVTSNETSAFVQSTMDQIGNLIPLDFVGVIFDGISSLGKDGFNLVERFFTRIMGDIFPPSKTQTLRITNVTTLKPNVR